MASRVRLGNLREMHDHPLGMTEAGFRADLTQHEAFTIGRGPFPGDADSVRSERELFVTAPDDEVLAVATITGVREYDDELVVDGDLVADHERVGTRLLIRTQAENVFSCADEESAWAGSVERARWVYVRALVEVATVKTASYDRRLAGADPTADPEVTLATANETMQVVPRYVMIHRSGKLRLGGPYADTADWDGHVEPWTDYGYVDCLRLDDVLGSSGDLDIDLLRPLTSRAAAAELLESLGWDKVIRRFVDDRTPLQ
ncbi:hypothetical protein [Rhodococcus sp. ACPA1]|uniref:hypothetical protein n=1 Tax=Rhodococcus sp. ACPA1 TaxID=2028572 RepID=UPI000BB0FE38|nr:hypothetical protein [Rhodococcus sp. ACPA1]PBC55440.1 hypothetical protein CJ177_20985 [Rhodococcus sp. ACPA1]